MISVWITLAGAVAAMVVGPLDPSHRAFHWVARTYSRLILRLFNVRLVVKGAEQIRPGQPYVYAANHASMFDIPAAVAGVPDRIHLIYKKELERIPFFGWGLRLGRTYIAIERGKGIEAAKSLERAIEKIRGGASVLLFAEGTRTSDGKLQPFKRGAFNLAARVGVPVVPLTINGSYSVLPKRTFQVNPGTIELIIEPPIPIPEAGNGKERELVLMEEVRKAVERNYVDQS